MGLELTLLGGSAFRPFFSGLPRAAPRPLRAPTAAAAFGEAPFHLSRPRCRERALRCANKMWRTRNPKRRNAPGRTYGLPQVTAILKLQGMRAGSPQERGGFFPWLCQEARV